MKYIAIHYNRPDFVELQYRCIRRLGGELVIVSTIHNRDIEAECRRLGIDWHLVPYMGNPSDSHAMALNWAIRMNDEAILMDHDTFPIAETSFTDLVGVQFVNKYTHLLPSYLGYKKRMASQMRALDMKPGKGGDTAYQTHRLMHKAKRLRNTRMDELLDGGQSQVMIDEYHADQLIAYHYIAGSNWTGSVPIEQKDRLLQDILSEYI